MDRPQDRKALDRRIVARRSVDRGDLVFHGQDVSAQLVVDRVKEYTKGIRLPLSTTSQQASSVTCEGPTISAADCDFS